MDRTAHNLITLPKQVEIALDLGVIANVPDVPENAEEDVWAASEVSTQRDYRWKVIHRKARRDDSLRLMERPY